MLTETETIAPGRSSSVAWILALVAALMIGVLVGWLAFGGDGTESSVDAEIEQEINKLIDDWLTAWNTGDGDLAQGLFAADGRYVSLYEGTDFDGWSADEIGAGVERRGGPGSYESARVGDPMIIEQPGAFHVVVTTRLHSFGREYFETFNIVEEDGSLKIRYTEPWYPLGLFQLADDLPPQPVGEEG